MAETKYSLASHMYIHSEERPFNCDQCEFAGRSRRSLTQHARIHTDAKPLRVTLSTNCSAQTAPMALHQITSSPGIFSATAT